MTDQSDVADLANWHLVGLAYQVDAMVKLHFRNYGDRPNATRSREDSYRCLFVSNIIDFTIDGLEHVPISLRAVRTAHLDEGEGLVSVKLTFDNSAKIRISGAKLSLVGWSYAPSS